MTPNVDFLMPIAAPAPFLAEAVKSVLDQSVTEWRLIAVLDGPAEEERAQLQALVPRSRLTVLSLSQRSGLCEALNSGLRVARAPFIARLDCDDINARSRLERQLAAAEEWPDAVLIGGAATVIDSGGRKLSRLSGETGRDVRRALLSRNQIVHSSAFLRRDALSRVGGYNAHCLLREDYELWLRLAREGPIANIPDVVVHYRTSDGQVSRRTPPALSLRLVGEARVQAAQAIGESRFQARARQFVWSMMQRPAVQRRFGRLNRLRER